MLLSPGNENFWFSNIHSNLPIVCVLLVLPKELIKRYRGSLKLAIVHLLNSWFHIGTIVIKDNIFIKKILCSRTMQFHNKFDSILAIWKKNIFSNDTKGFPYKCLLYKVNHNALNKKDNLEKNKGMLEQVRDNNHARRRLNAGTSFDVSLWSDTSGWASR
jgi:hypothetical protein